MWLTKKNAIADSKQKATLLAKAYGATLSPIKQIQYQGAASHLPQAQFRLESMSRSAVQDEAPGRYIYERLRFSDHINVIFELIVKNWRPTNDYLKRRPKKTPQKSPWRFFILGPTIYT